MKNMLRNMKNKGQTTLEYALDSGVNIIGAIMMGQKFFGKGGDASKVFEAAISNSQQTLETGSPGN